MHKKYFFFDIDGTLLSEVDHLMPQSCKETLRQLEANGHFVAIATSRPYCLTHQTAKDMEVKNYVCDGGDGLVVNEQIIEVLPLNLEDCLMLAKETMAANLPIATSIDMTNNRYSPNDDFINAYPYLKKAFDFVTDETFDVLSASAIHKMCIVCTKDDEQLLPSLKKIPHYRISDRMILVEAIDKYQGILKMMNHLQAPLEDVVVFGDGTNDLDMFRQAPMSIAMGNAVAPLKAIASYITDKASEDGIQKACEYFGWI